MKATRIRLLVLVSIFAFFLFGFSSCKKARTGARYDLKGKVVAVDKGHQLVTVAHDDIKGYMPGMVMPFTIKDDWAFDVLTPGDQITATLVVDGPATWLEDVVITEEGSNSEAIAAARPGDGKTR